MEKSFDFGRILKKHVKQKPVQFVSVSGGVKKRREASFQYRKSTRLTVFDNLRSLPTCESPAPVVNTKSKSEHRRLQLEKWKEEKEKLKKEAAAKKKKPFLVGVAHAPLKFVPPPPPKTLPSTSGRVTRSHASKQPKATVNKQTKPPQSFAPKNATFRPPNLNLKEMPTLAPLTKKTKRNISNYLLEMPHTQKPVPRQTRSKAALNMKPLEKQIGPSKFDTKPKVKAQIKPSPKPKKLTSKNLQSSDSSESNTQKSASSSSEDTGSSTDKSPVLKITSKSKHVYSSSESDQIAESSPPRNKTPKKSFPKNSNAQHTPKATIPKSESSSEERLRSPKDILDVAATPEQFAQEASKISPTVTMSRGKDNARREMKKKMEEGLLDDDASDMDSVDYFRRQLDSEIRRILERCDLWDKVQTETLLPESVQELVLGAVGQGRLLVSQKLRQFGALVEACARPIPGAALVTPADLRGFWDMVFMQVENIDMRFKKLEDLRQCNWVEEKPLEIKKKVVKNVTKKSTKAPTGPSRLKDMIAAARKAKKQQELAPASPLAVAVEADSKTFDAGFFSVKSPVRSPAVATPNRRPTLLKAVLSNEAQKSASKNSASFAMLRASVLSKNMEHDGISLLPQTPVNLSATPGRSILKSTNKNASMKKSGKKSIKVVLFDDADDIENANEVKNEENKENSVRKPRLRRQDAVLDVPCGVMTRRQRKSFGTPIQDDIFLDKTPKRSTKKKA